MNLLPKSQSRTLEELETCKRLQGLLGQDWRLQEQLADAELAGERQVSQVAVATADLLFLKTEVSCEDADALEKLRVVRLLTSVTVCPTISTTAAVMASGLASRLPYSRSKQRMLTGCRNICWQSSAGGSGTGAVSRDGPGGSQETGTGPTLVEVVVGSMHHV